MKTAVIGLGIMGTGVARSLQGKGLLSAVYNRTAARAEPFAALGMRVAASPRAAAEGVDVVIAVVGDDDSSRAVWLGGDGALAGMSAGAVAVEFSTLSPAWVCELGAIAAEHGVEFLDAPMTGTKPQAEAAQLRLFVGGDASVLEHVRPVLAAVSTEQYHLGPVGAGATWKLINNMQAAVHAAAVAEALTLAERAGLNLDSVRPLLSVSPFSSPMVQNKAPRMLDHAYDDVHFALKWMDKDARYALALGDELGVPLRTVEAAVAVMADALAKGYAEQDVASMVEGMRE
ncbi:MAG TPA: NAD(P)-dependent oxidoreductase [Candidatus Limnocylindrales bacterium]|nr:NAD(P)-dependent oxidoreductase [Candidatus Limnocylindrales bacterium]